MIFRKFSTENFSDPLRPEIFFKNFFGARQISEKIFGYRTRGCQRGGESIVASARIDLRRIRRNSSNGSHRSETHTSTRITTLLIQPIRLRARRAHCAWFPGSFFILFFSGEVSGKRVQSAQSARIEAAGLPAAIPHSPATHPETRIRRGSGSYLSQSGSGPDTTSD